MADVQIEVNGNFSSIRVSRSTPAVDSSDVEALLDQVYREAKAAVRNNQPVRAAPKPARPATPPAFLVNGQRWPFDQPHTGYTRYGWRSPAGVLLKGLSLDDARDMASADGGTVMRQLVVYVTGGPDEGAEVLYRWRECVS